MAGPTVSWDSVVKHFESLPDLRHTRNRHGDPNHEKESIKGKSQIAGWSNDFLMEVLVAQRT